MTGSCKLTADRDTDQVFSHFDFTNWKIPLKTALQRPSLCLDGMTERGVRKIVRRRITTDQPTHTHTHFSSSYSYTPATLRWEETLIGHVFINKLMMSITFLWLFSSFNACTEWNITCRIQNRYFQLCTVCQKYDFVSLSQLPFFIYLFHVTTELEKSNN